MAVFPWWICWCDIFSLLCSEGCHGDALLWQYVFVFMCLLFFPLSVRGCLFVHVWIDHQVLTVSLSCSFRLPQRQCNPCTNEVTHWYSTTTPLSLDKGKKRLQKKSHFSSAELKKKQVFTLDVSPEAAQSVDVKQTSGEDALWTSLGRCCGNVDLGGDPEADHGPYVSWRAEDLWGISPEGLVKAARWSGLCWLHCRDRCGIK